MQGTQGLTEQRTAGETSFPLADAHGDITAIADQVGEVSSRQTYDPWGAQLSGPTLEMGYLGTQQRRTDPTNGLIQMGVRIYAPELGAFLSEDPVYGHIGIGTSFDRYAYAWDNPLNLYDLDGRDVCVPGLFGKVCAEAVVEDVGNTAGDLGNSAWNAGKSALGGVGSGVDTAWDWTAPGRQLVGDRAQDFVKSNIGRWISSRGDEVGRAFTCIAERVVQQPGPVGCQEKAEQWKPEPEAPEVPPNLPPPGVPGKDPLPSTR